jgi:hypothetical protein
MSELHKKECANCHRMFEPSKHNRHSQEYCTKPECKRVSHNKSQAKYRKKACNQTLEKRIENSNNVKDWQRRNPGYNKKYRKKRKKNRTKSLKTDNGQARKSDSDKGVLSDFVLTNTIRSHSLKIIQLTDTVEYQNKIITGLISHLTDSFLSDIMDIQKNMFYDIGKSISGMSSETADIKINKTLRRAGYEKQSIDQSG